MDDTQQIHPDRQALMQQPETLEELAPRTDTSITPDEKVEAWRKQVLKHSPPHKTGANSIPQADRDERPPSQNQYTKAPTLRQQPWWWSLQELKLDLRRLPRGTTARDIYEALHEHGNISKIDINEENDRFGRAGDATVIFSPPPREQIWGRPRWKVQIRGRREEIQISQAPVRSFMHDSPIDKNRKYNERMVLQASSISFGFMHAEKTMMDMLKIDAVESTAPEIQIVVDLSQKKVEIRFALPPPQLMRGNALDRKSDYNDFVFKIPFTKLHKIFEQISDNERVFTIPLESPPEAYERRKQWRSSFADADMHWVERRLWFRQTNILADARTAATNPIGIHTQQPIIDVGRWTTYRLVIPGTDINRQVYESLRQALVDYNVKFITSDTPQVTVLPRQESELSKVLGLRTEEPELGDVLAAMREMADNVPSLAFPVQYQLEVCMSQEIVHPHNLSLDFLQKLYGIKVPEAVALLEFICERKKRYYEPMKIFDVTVPRRNIARTVPAACLMSRSATITPSTIYFATPVVEVSNRVVRKYEHLQERFLRVKFSDELGLGKVKSADDNANDEVYARISRALKYGILIGNRRYDFLAFGNSQFREHGAYFFASTLNTTAETIRGELGDFENMTGLKSVAKWCARLGQNFSTTRAINSAGKIEIKDHLDDIRRGEYIFTDGVGQISPVLAAMIGNEFGVMNAAGDPPPSVFQFRMGGCKGILALNPKMPGLQVAVRPSQYKFPASLMDLEIIRISQYAAATTNRQLIALLHDLGVSNDVFLDKLHQQLEHLNEAMVDEEKAVEYLSKYIDINQFSLKLAAMIENGFMAAKDPFVMSTLQLWRTWSMKYLKDKARLFIDKGACVIGCADEYWVLKGHFNAVQPGRHDSQSIKEQSLPEIFLQVDAEEPGQFKIIEGLCVFFRCPSLHPGDIRVVKAVDKPELHHIRNAVVLPTTGDRDLANMCSGGDLDGDDFFVIWDQDLLPTVSNWNLPPMQFPPVQGVRTDRAVTADDIANFFVAYMKNDKLGPIANAHLALADYNGSGVFSQNCLQLAELHSHAVDYPKSGVPVVVPRSLNPPKWPHFMEKKHIAAKRQYTSMNILGQMYDAVKHVNFVPQQEVTFDERVLNAYTIEPEMLTEATKLKSHYDAAIRRIMAQHEIKTEFECFSQFVLSHNFEKKDYDFAQELGHTMFVLQKQFKELCVEAAGGTQHEVLGPFVAAMYTVAMTEVKAAKEKQRDLLFELDEGELPDELLPENMPFVSFPWIFDQELIRIATGKMPIGSRGQGASRMQGLSTRNRPEKSAAVDNPLVVETRTGTVQQGEDLMLFDDAKTAEQEAEELFAKMVDARTFHGHHASRSPHPYDDDEGTTQPLDVVPISTTWQPRKPEEAAEDDESVELEYVAVNDNVNGGPVVGQEVVIGDEYDKKFKERMRLVEE